MIDLFEPGLDLGRLRRLTLRPRYREKALGARTSRHIGHGQDFEKVRPYVPGDDVRHIDWNVTARTCETHVKVFCEEKRQHFVLLLDISSSMEFGSGPLTALQHAAQLTSALMWLALCAGDEVSAMTFHQGGVADFGRGRHPSYHPRWRHWVTRQLAQSRETASNSQGGTDAALRQLAKQQRRRPTNIFIISDFLDDAALPLLAPLAARHDLVCVLIDDPGRPTTPLPGGIYLRPRENPSQTGWLRRPALPSTESLIPKLEQFGAQVVRLRTNRPPAEGVEAVVTGLRPQGARR